MTRPTRHGSGLTAVRVLYGLTLGAYMGALIWVAVRAPATVASRFGTDGQPDGWTSRGSFVITYALTGVLFLVLFPLFGGLAARMPADFVNVRNKEYWLAPKHRAAFAARLREDLMVIGCLTAWLVMMAMLVSVQATIAGTGLPVWITGVLAGYAVVIIGYVAWMAFGRYRVPAASAS